MEPFATVQDAVGLWRTMTADEQERAENLLPVISDTLRYEAEKVGKCLSGQCRKVSYSGCSGQDLDDVNRCGADDADGRIGDGIFLFWNVSCPRRRTVY